MSGWYWLLYALLTVGNVGLFVTSWRWLGEIKGIADELRADLTSRGAAS